MDIQLTRMQAYTSMMILFDQCPIENPSLYNVLSYELLIDLESSVRDEQTEAKIWRLWTEVSDAVLLNDGIASNKNPTFYDPISLWQAFQSIPLFLEKYIESYTIDNNQYDAVATIQRFYDIMHNPPVEAPDLWLQWVDAVNAMFATKKKSSPLMIHNNDNQVQDARILYEYLFIKHTKTPEIFYQSDLFIEMATDVSNYYGKDIWGNDVFGKILPDGTQIWAQVQITNMINFGWNPIPRHWNPITGFYELEIPHDMARLI